MIKSLYARPVILFGADAPVFFGMLKPRCIMVKGNSCRPVCNERGCRRERDLW